MARRRGLPAFYTTRLPLQPGDKRERHLQLLTAIAAQRAKKLTPLSEGTVLTFCLWRSIIIVTGMALSSCSLS
jgi:hypothetical protein